MSSIASVEYEIELGGFMTMKAAEGAFGLKIFACGPGTGRYSLDASPLAGGNIKIHN